MQWYMEIETRKREEGWTGGKEGGTEVHFFEGKQFCFIGIRVDMISPRISNYFLTRIVLKIINIWG